jgi:hypothetical protein
LAFFFYNNVLIQLFRKPRNVLNQKRHFSPFFNENIFKIKHPRYSTSLQYCSQFTDLIKFIILFLVHWPDKGDADDSERTGGLEHLGRRGGEEGCVILNSFLPKIFFKKSLFWQTRPDPTKDLPKLTGLSTNVSLNTLNWFWFGFKDGDSLCACQ